MQASSNSDVQESLLEMAGLDFLVAIMTGESGTGDVMIRSLALRENPQMIVVLTTLVAVFVFWKRFSGQKPARPWEAPRPLIVREDPDVDLDPGKKKVAILFGTQTGIAEGFAKVISWEHSWAQCTASTSLLHFDILALYWNLWIVMVISHTTANRMLNYEIFAGERQLFPFCCSFVQLY